MNKPPESNFSLHVDGAFVLKGDSSSVAVVFGNLDGRNFMPDENDPGKHVIKWSTHEDWMAGMSDAFGGLKLERGMTIEMKSPEGQVMLRSTIAKSIPENYRELFELMRQQDPQVTPPDASARPRT